MADALHVEIDADGIAVATLDLPGQSMNVLGETLLGPLAALAQRLATDPALSGLVIATGKKDFCAGADVGHLAALASARAAFDESTRFQALLRRLETAGKPVVAAIRGRCLGGGLELALACHRRLVLDDGSTVVLNTDSVVQVRFRKNRRDIILRKGEASFQVAHDAFRPFVVHADGVAVKAVGTSFAVREQPGGVKVTVAELSSLITSGLALSSKSACTVGVPTIASVDSCTVAVLVSPSPSVMV